MPKRLLAVALLLAACSHGPKYDAAARDACGLMSDFSKQPHGRDSHDQLETWMRSIGEHATPSKVAKIHDAGVELVSFANTDSPAFEDAPFHLIDACGPLYTGP